MPDRRYPSVAEALEIQRLLIELFGGAHGLLDKGRLEAAVFRPQIGYYESIEEEAAALMESLGNNHPFVDGNKRIAFTLTDVFLRMNGYFLDVEPEAANKFIRGAMARGDFRFGPVRDWIARNRRKLTE